MAAVIDSTDLAALFNSLLTPVCQQLHVANLALEGWLAREGDRLRRAAGQAGFDIECSADECPKIGIITLSGANEANDNGVGVIFRPKVSIRITSVSLWGSDGVDPFMQWIDGRYKGAKVIHCNDQVRVTFDLEQNEISAQ